MTHERKPTHLDLFSGIGGFSLAFEAEGFETIGFSEIEPYARKVLKRHWPDVPNLGDIRNLRGVRADVITGGFPCQPFSLAGKRRGTADDRHLWPEMLRVIDEARPAWVLGENVPGIIGMELDSVLSDLENIGYACWPVTVPAVAVDAKHRRDRLWVVAYARSQQNNPTGKRPIGYSEPQRSSVEHRQETSRPAPWGSDTNNTGRCGENMADAMRPRFHAGAQGGIHRGQKSAGSWNVESQRPSRWPVEPELGRVADGIPNRSHRLKGLGNAIVPAVAQIFARAIRQMIP